MFLFVSLASWSLIISFRDIPTVIFGKCPQCYQKAYNRSFLRNAIGILLNTECRFPGRECAVTVWAVKCVKMKGRGGFPEPAASLCGSFSSRAEIKLQGELGCTAPYVIPVHSAPKKTAFAAADGQFTLSLPGKYRQIHGKCRER